MQQVFVPEIVLGSEDTMMNKGKITALKKIVF